MHRLIPILLSASAATAQVSGADSRVNRLIDRAVIVDLHDDTAQMILDEHYKPGERHDFGQVDIPRMRAGGMSGLFFSIWVDPDRYSPGRESDVRLN